MRRLMLVTCMLILGVALGMGPAFVSAGGLIIKPTNISVEDEGGFGYCEIMACPGTCQGEYTCLHNFVATTCCGRSDAGKCCSVPQEDVPPGVGQVISTLSPQRAPRMLVFEVAERIAGLLEGDILVPSCQFDTLDKIRQAPADASLDFKLIRVREGRIYSVEGPANIFQRAALQEREMVTAAADPGAGKKVGDLVPRSTAGVANMKAETGEVVTAISPENPERR